MELKARQQLCQLSRLLERRARQDRVTVEVDEDDAATAPHQAPRGQRRVDPAGEKADDASAHADRHPEGAALPAEGIEGIVRQQLDVDRELRIGEIGRPSSGHLYLAADFALDLRRREWKSLVGALGRDSKGS